MQGCWELKGGTQRFRMMMTLHALPDHAWIVCRRSQGAAQVTRRPAALRPGFQPAAGRSHSCPNGVKAEKGDEQQLRRQQLTQTAPAIANTLVRASPCFSPCFACGNMPGTSGSRLCISQFEGHLLCL